MTEPKVPTTKAGGSRFYVDPITQAQVPGVTSVLNMLPKEFLKWWAAKLVAETAVDQAGNWIGMALSGDRQGAIDYLKRAPTRFTGGAADRGTEAHALFEQMSMGNTPPRVHPDMAVFQRHFGAFLDKMQPEFHHLEETVWNTNPGYAGSFDWIATIQGELVLGDNKTTRSGIHAEVALQLNAYAAAEFLMDADGERTPMPKITGAAVMHVVPEGWQLTPVMLDREVLMPVFEALLQVHAWEKTLKKRVIGKPLAQGSDDES
jgi:hypothetical protein